jgi:precorrin-8X/cobalt-precorrin-8 methylmutase
MSKPAAIAGGRKTPLFDAYLVVDWSAASRPVQGADSIWYALVRGGAVVAVANPATRREAERRIGDLLAEERAAGRRVLAGFDFPFGYSAGFAKRLGGQNWLDVWSTIDEGLEDDEQNRNNRFALAAELNRRAGAPIFWGCPVGWSGNLLGPTNARCYEREKIEERRWCEHRVAGPQPVWKLYGNGSAGGQALTGIPVLKRLRERLGATVWPFETGLRPSSDGVVLAEVYPSLVQPEEGSLPKDLGQVRALAAHFAALDRDDALAACFAGDPTLTPSQRADVEREEAWILGVTKEGARRPRRPPLQGGRPSLNPKAVPA